MNIELARTFLVVVGNGRRSNRSVILPAGREGFVSDGSEPPEAREE